MQLIKHIKPKIINNSPEHKLIILSGILLDNILPKAIAIESLTTIPKIAPIIKEILKLGYCIPRPIEDKKVLSPNSPTAILKAINKIYL